jgi:hypothetical protein
MDHFHDGKCHVDGLLLFWKRLGAGKVSPQKDSNKILVLISFASRPTRLPAAIPSTGFKQAQAGIIVFNIDSQDVYPIDIKHEMRTYPVSGH